MDTKQTALDCGASVEDVQDEETLLRARPRLIAFSGPAGVGKSEASALLVRRHGFVQTKFAAPLKGMLTTMYEFAGLDQNDIQERLEGGLKEVPDAILGGTTPRRAMQTLGGEWGRDLVKDDLWVSLWRRDVQRKLSAGLSVVLDDLRYPNEAAAIRELGGEIWSIKGNTRRAAPSHASEVFDFDADGVISNTTDIIGFWHRVLDTLGLD